MAASNDVDERKGGGARSPAHPRPHEEALEDDGYLRGTVPGAPQYTSPPPLPPAPLPLAVAATGCGKEDQYLACVVEGEDAASEYSEPAEGEEACSVHMQFRHRRRLAPPSRVPHSCRTPPFHIMCSRTMTSTGVSSGGARL
ncbi:hypothetical protein E2562_022031 [Oryza meyeriana var. granulata]|uniref:Uncharacterized protein n=1 Tax=Oryza meyeriana var. granulata TaxID=110450 RepID=A0A6G1ENJ1_9ORYZ|nr:hypothetical protein E2562_022031 [Oryza meyeriana var. granulata]